MNTTRLLAAVALVVLGTAVAGAPNALAGPKRPAIRTPASPTATPAKASTKATTQTPSTTPPASGPWKFRAGVLRGVLSPDTENAKGEHDPRPGTPKLVAASAPNTSLVPPPGQVYLSKMPNANDVATAAATRLGADSIHVALLGLHKYMLADCLGVKVSVGDFELKLGSPSIKIEDAGVVASYSIDKISFDAFKLRFRPDPTDLAEPCHFSGRVELGGEIDNASVVLRYNPIIDVQHCTVGNPGGFTADFHIGYINIGPVPPGIADLENPFKDMIGDAVNGAFFAASQIAGSSTPVAYLLEGETKALDKVLGQICNNVISQTSQALSGGSSLSAVGSSATNAAAGASASTATAGAPSTRLRAGGAGTPAGNAPYKIVRNADLKGRLGRIVVAFPKAAKAVTARVAIRAPGSNEDASSTYGGATVELLPGKYDVTINGVKVPGVAVRSRSDTHVRVGVIYTHGSAKTRFEIFAPGSKEAAEAVYGDSALGFPIGAFEVGVAGQRAKVTVEEGKVTDF